MSYYSYFKLKSDSKYNSDDLKHYDEYDNQKFRSLLKGVMIKSYYEDNIENKLLKIDLYGRMLGKSLVESSILSYAKDIKEKGELIRNHSKDEWEMQRDIDDYDSNLDRYIENLFILSCVRFTPDNTYSDTAKNEMDYLQYDYMNKVEEEINCLEEISEDYAFAKFTTENCIRRTEDSEYPEEETQKEA